MLEKMHNLINKKILCTTGTFLGQVKDVLFCLKTQKIKGFEYIVGSNKEEYRFLSFNNIFSINYKNLMIDNKKYPQKYDGSNILRISEEKGKRIILLHGKDVGILEDIVFKVSNGEIMYLEVSDGILRDLLNGRKKILPKNILTVGKDFIVIEKEG